MMVRALFLMGLMVSSTLAAAAMPTKHPVEIEGDLFFYDQNQDAYIAKGEVKVVQGDETVLADEIIYIKKQDKLYAKGHVSLRREDGSIYYADVLNLENQMHRGRLLSFKARINKKGLFASHAAEMIDKKHTRLYSLVFSPCQVCKDNLRPFVPLWQVRASEANINLETETVHYKNARIEAHGVPVFYTPYFSMPTPGAKRKTGFLNFGFKGSKVNGAAVQTPFYLNIAPNKDFTYTPSISTNSKYPTIHEMEFRHKVKNGSYQLAGSLADGTKLNKDGSRASGRYIYGHINSYGDFHQGSGFFAGDYGFKVQRVRDSSLTYSKVHKLMMEDTLTSKLYHRKWSDDYYVDSQVITFQDLRPGMYEATTPNALPFVRAEHEKKLQAIDATMNTKLNVLHINRLQGTRYNRFVMENEVKKRISMPYGQIFGLSLKVRGDAYQVGYRAIKNPGAAPQNSGGQKGSYGRVHPQLKAEWSYPLINKMGSASAVLEPVVQLIVSPNRKAEPKIPNEDSQVFDLDASNLFSDNRYLGKDLLETGNRANYGVRGSIHNLLLKRIGFLLGQSYRMKKTTYKSSSGLEDKLSDYVAQVTYEPLTNLEILHRLRLDHRNGAVNRNEVSLLYQHNKWSFMADYSAASKKATSYSNIYRQEISLATAYNFYDSWWVTARYRRNLGQKPVGVKREMIEDGLGLNYKGECFNMITEVKRDYTTLNNLVPTTLYLFKIELPTF